MDAMRTAYQKTALHRMGIPFDDAIKLESVRIVLAASVKRQANAAPARQTARA